MKRATIAGLIRANARLAKRLDLALSARNEAVSRIADLTEKSEATERDLRADLAITRDERDAAKGRLSQALAELNGLQEQNRLAQSIVNRKTNELGAAEAERRCLVMMGNALASAYVKADERDRNPLQTVKS